MGVSSDVQEWMRGEPLRSRRLSLSQISVFTSLVLVTVGVTMLGDRPVLISFGPISLLGLITGGVAVVGLLLLFLAPTFHRQVLSVLWPLIGFWFYDVFATLWSPLFLSSVQNTVVWGGFLFLILLSARVARQKPGVIQYVFWIIDVATYGLLAYCVYLIAIGTQSVAGIPLLLVLLSCYHLVRWHAGSSWSFIVATLFFLTNILVGARTPAGVGLGLYLLVELMRGGAHRWIRVIWIATTLGVTIIGIWFSYPPLREAFLSGDNALAVGEVTINTAGRLNIWSVTLQSWLESPIWGKGYDMPAVLPQAHPHNDYLRILHHLGILGIFLWSIFYAKTLRYVWKCWKYSRENLKESAEVQVYGITFLMIVATAMTMLTDNTIIYSYLMYLLAICIGTAIGISVRIKP